MIQSLNKESFENTVKSNDIVLVDFYADWCGPCQSLKPALKAVAEDYEGKAVIAKVDVDREGELAAAFGIRSIPTLIFFKNGKAVNVLNGLQTKQALTNTLDSLATVDA